MIIIFWLFLITINQSAHSTVITVNNNGNNSFSCCVLGYCECNLLSDALVNMNDNNVVNITSPAVSLSTPTYIQNLNNLAIISNVGTIVKCNNTGFVQCFNIANIYIEGITWDQCGNISRPSIPGIEFNSGINITIYNCTFQQFKVCTAVKVHSMKLVIAVNNKFMHNAVSDASVCIESYYSSFQVTYTISVYIYYSMFHFNGNPNQESSSNNGSLYASYWFLVISDTSFISNGIRGMHLVAVALDSIPSTTIFERVNISANRFSIYAYMQGKLNVISSYISHNHKGGLDIYLDGSVTVELYNTTFANNIGATYTFGTALYVFTSNRASSVNISLCNFLDNFGGISAVYIINSDYVLITSSNFVNNKNESALRVTNCFLTFYKSTIFKDNYAKSGAAIYVAERSQIIVDDGSSIQFINNTASLRGGAIYIDLTNCYDRGIVFTTLTENNAISFVDNSAKLSGNSIYFNIPDSCDVVRDYNKIDSAAYAPYKFNYTQSPEITGSAIATTPYKVQFCSSTNCDLLDSSECVIVNDAMLGQYMYFNTTLCDYFNGTGEAIRFQVICINCGFEFRVLDDEILIQNGSSNGIGLLSVDADSDLKTDINVSLTIASLLALEYKQLTGTLTLKLSSCNNGYLFSKQSQQCECYNKDNYIQCDGDSASIKLGYWFGVFSGAHVFSICHNDYCNFFTHREVIRNEFYNLPEEVDGQCKPHRTGVACGECSEGYTLAYNSPDCISVEKCSPGITVLVLVLTALYWIGVIAVMFGVSHCFNTQQVSIAYLHGIVYFYSIVDILLVTDLHKSNGLFYVTTILSSFAKLNPQFLGRFCFLNDLDAIDQQFFHYCHVVFISSILIAIYIMAKCNNRALFYVKHHMVQVTCLVLLFAYSSITSTSLLLLKAVKFDFNDGLYTYLSPHLRYYAHRHALYASVAIICGLLVTIGFPSLLATEPLMMKIFNDDMNKDAWKSVAVRIKEFMKKRTSLMRIKLLLDQLQDCYKDQYRWFAAYYLICRLVIMLITYFANNNYNNMLYYLQTACVVIVMTHIWIQPYKNDTLNVLDTAILLVVLLIVNLSAFSFSTSTTEGIAISLLITPLLLLFGMGVKKFLVSKSKMFQANDKYPALALDSISTPR